VVSNCKYNTGPIWIWHSVLISFLAFDAVTFTSDFQICLVPLVEP
jgi:hypothetical protein